MRSTATESLSGRWRMASWTASPGRASAALTGRGQRHHEGDPGAVRRRPPPNVSDATGQGSAQPNSPEASGTLAPGRPRCTGPAEAVLAQPGSPRCAGLRLSRGRPPTEVVVGGAHYLSGAPDCCDPACCPTCISALSSLLGTSRKIAQTTTRTHLGVRSIPFSDLELAAGLVGMDIQAAPSSFQAPVRYSGRRKRRWSDLEAACRPRLAGQLSPDPGLPCCSASTNRAGAAHSRFGLLAGIIGLPFARSARTN